MDIKRAVKIFPSFIRKEIIPTEAREQNIEVYRVCKWGKIESKAFLSTYEEREMKLCPYRDLDLSDPSTYSTSCYEKKKDIKRYFKLMSKKHEPLSILTKGLTKDCCGVSQRTSERIPTQKDSHVDWWLYINSKPEEHFEEV